MKAPPWNGQKWITRMWGGGGGGEGVGDGAEIKLPLFDPNPSPSLSFNSGKNLHLFGPRGGDNK